MESYAKWDRWLCAICVLNLGYGSTFNCLERRRSSGLSGHNSGALDLPEGMAAFWCQDVTGASCVCVVTEVLTEEPGGTSLKIPFPRCPFFPVHRTWSSADIYFLYFITINFNWDFSESVVKKQKSYWMHLTSATPHLFNCMHWILHTEYHCRLQSNYIYIIQFMYIKIAQCRNLRYKIWCHKC